MMDLKTRAELNTGTTAVRAGFELDLPSLEAWLNSSIDDFSGLLTVEQFKGGQSNPTYKLITGRGSYVLRSKPPGALLASAHAVEREYRVMAALAGTGVPVPRVYGLCTDAAVLGRTFYVMDFTGGQVVWDLPSDRWDMDARRRIWTAGVDAAAGLHSVDIDAVGLRDFGKTGGYVARQYKRWSEQYLTHTRDGIANPALDRLIEWLPERLPAVEPTSIVHGDLQLSNMIQQDDGSSVAAVIDWELSTLGNPISDFAYYCRDYHLPTAAGGFGENPSMLGLPEEREMIDRWSARTGFAIGDDWPVYVVFNMFRLAAIRQGVAKRAKQGNAASANADVAANGAVVMADQAWKLAQSLG